MPTLQPVSSIVGNCSSFGAPGKLVRGLQNPRLEPDVTLWLRARRRALWQGLVQQLGVPSENDTVDCRPMRQARDVALIAEMIDRRKLFGVKRRGVGHVYRFSKEAIGDERSQGAAIAVLHPPVCTDEAQSPTLH